jgi:hypothetical protein
VLGLPAMRATSETRCWWWPGDVAEHDELEQNRSSSMEIGKQRDLGRGRCSGDG